MKAYIRADPREDPSILSDIEVRLASQGIHAFFTNKRWQDIPDDQPYIYYRNPYIRFEAELKALKCHLDNPSFRYIKSSNGEIITVNHRGDPKVFFTSLSPACYIVSTYKPLPIMLITHQRPEYLRLALNSLHYNCKDVIGQKIYIVASDPDPLTQYIIKEFLEENVSAEAVFTENNLGYCITNFGCKYWSLPKFLHFEDDGILPESLQYLLPGWTQQLAYRATTADFVGFRVSEQNKNSMILRSEQHQDPKYTYLNYDDNSIWNYFIPDENQLPAISGLGLVIDSDRAYRNLKQSEGFQTDLGIYRSAHSACIINIPVYHLGANQIMDYPRKPHPTSIGRIQAGICVRTGQRRLIDLEVDWAAYKP